MALKLNDNQEMLLALVRCGMWGTGVDLPVDKIEWSKVVRMAKSQSVLGIVAKMILVDRSVSSVIPNELRLKLKSFIVSNVMTSDIMTETIKKVVSAMNDAGLHPVLLKGHGLAANYPYPQLRQCGDVDLYVGPEKSVAAYEVLRLMTDAIEPESSARWGRHFSAFFDEIEIEVHRHTSSHAVGKYTKVYKAAAEKGFNKDLSEMPFGDVVVKTPSVNFNAYYIFDHLFEHFMTSGIGLRHLCDWVMFLHRYKDSLDREYLRDLLVEMDMLEPWQAFGCIIVRYLGFPVEEFPFYADSEKADRIFEYILAEGNFGKDTPYYTRRSRNYLLTKLNAIRCHLSRGYGMLAVFPRHELRHFLYILSNYFLHLREDLKLKFTHGR